MSDYVLNLDAIYSAGLLMNTMAVLMTFVQMAQEAEPIRASEFDHAVVEELKEKGLILQSGNSLRFPKEIFRLV